MTMRILMMRGAAQSDNAQVLLLIMLMLIMLGTILADGRDDVCFILLNRPAFAPRFDDASQRVPGWER